MSKKVVMASAIVGLAVSSFNAQAAILSYGGYTHDTNTDIVTGNGLEWLQWDRTLNESINSVQSQLNTIDGGGWSIATNVQMAELFNAFDFGLTFDVDHSTTQTASTGYQYPDTLAETDQLFIAMFGDTYEAGGYSYCYSNNHCYQASNAIFGYDVDNDGLHNTAFITDDYQHNNTGELRDGVAQLNRDQVSPNVDQEVWGVALVRDASVVPVPAAVWLFGSGLIGLVGMARRKK